MNDHNLPTSEPVRNGFNTEAVAAALGVTVGSAAQKLILVLLAEQSDAEAVSSIGQTELARRACVDVATVSRNLAALERAGAIRRTPRYRDDGARMADQFKLVLTHYRPASMPKRKAAAPPADAPPLPPHIAAALSALWGVLGDEFAGGEAHIAAPTPGRPTAAKSSGSETHAGGGLGDLPPLTTLPPTSSSKQEAASLSARDRKAIASRVYHACNDASRQATSLDKIGFALRDAEKRGHDLRRVADAVISYVSSGEQQALGAKARQPHWIIDDDEWIDIEAAPPLPPPAPAPDPDPAAVMFEGRAFIRPKAGAIDPVGTEKVPGPGRQLSWLRRCWPHTPSSWDTHRWGPRPDQLDNRIWPSVFEAFASEQESAA